MVEYRLSGKGGRATYILVHQTRFANTAVAQDDDLPNPSLDCDSHSIKSHPQSESFAP
jgi:hypothetical protein